MSFLVKNTKGCTPPPLHISIVILMIFFLALVGCDSTVNGGSPGTEPSQTNESGNTGTEGNENGTDNPVDDDLMSQINALDSEKQSILINSLNDIDIFNESGISFSLRSLEDGSLDFTVTMPETVSFSVSPVYHKDETGADTEFADLIETYKKINADQASAFIQKVETAIELYELPDGFSDSEIDVTKLKTAAKAKVRANQNTTTFEATPGTVSKIYLKMSDVISSELDNIEFLGVSRITDTGSEERIQGSNDKVSKALRFGTEISDIVIDFNDVNQSTTNNLGKFYRGGYIFDSENTNVSLINTKNAILKGRVFPLDFKGDASDKRSIFYKLADLTENIPTMSLANREGNIYGTGLDKILDKYYNNIGASPLMKFNLDETNQYDAKDALIENGVQKTMFNPDNSYNTNAHTINADFASFLLSKSVDVKNVVINNIKNWPDTRTSQLGGTLANSVIDVDMSKVTSLKVKGLVLFNGKSPTKMSANDLTKIILKEYNGEAEFLSGYLRYDISDLGNKQEEILTRENNPVFFYLSENESLFNKLRGEGENGQAFILPSGKYKTNKTGLVEYSNADIEKAGNGKTYSSGKTLNKGEGTLNPYPLSRANNIKLTPMQRLLLDNQNTIG